MTEQQIIDGIIEREGREFTDHLNDRGGPTKFGVTRRELARWRVRPVSIEDVRDLTEAEAREIYRERYIRGPRFAEIKPVKLRLLVIDIGVLHGVKDAGRWLQEALGGLKIDGVVGPKTLSAANGLTPIAAREMFKRVLARRYLDFALIVERDRSQGDFIEGWIRRANEFLLLI